MPEGKTPHRKARADSRGQQHALNEGNRVSPARWAAFKVLQQVEDVSTHSDDALHGPAMIGLSQPDRNLVTALVLGVLRWQIPLDAELNGLLARPDQLLPSPVRLALRIGAFQLRHMNRIPAHAALSESVELTRAAGQPKSAALVNAVLRRLLTVHGPRKPIVENIEAAALRLGHPAWLVRRWELYYGRAAALAICEYGQHQPAAGELFVQPTPAEGGEEAGPAAADLLDDGSRLVAELAAVSHSSPQRIWDACAAPGGKTIILAQRHPTAELLATDISPRRLTAMQNRLEHALCGRPFRTLRADAAMLPPTEGLFDLVMCDVPCSGTGTLARNPEIRHRLAPTDLERQARRQREILTAALQRLSPRGRLVYSTCSLEPEENEQVIQSALQAQGNAKLIPVGPLLEALEERQILRPAEKPLQSLVRSGMLRTLPGASFRGDGFFAAVLARSK